MSAWGYDCSGFAYATHQANGYLIPRDATDQARKGKEVGLDSIQPGDLLFFAYEKGKGLSTMLVFVMAKEKCFIHLKRVKPSN